MKTAFFSIFIFLLFFSCEKAMFVLAEEKDKKLDPIYIDSWEGFNFFLKNNVSFKNHDLQGGIIVEADSILINGEISSKLKNYKLWLTQTKGIPEYGEFYEVAILFDKERNIEIGPDLKHECNFYNQYDTKTNINIFVGDSIHGLWENTPVQVQIDFDKDQNLKNIKNINLFF